MRGCCQAAQLKLDSAWSSSGRNFCGKVDCGRKMAKRRDLQQLIRATAREMMTGQSELQGQEGRSLGDRSDRRCCCVKRARPTEQPARRRQ